MKHIIEFRSIDGLTKFEELYDHPLNIFGEKVKRHGILYNSMAWSEDEIEAYNPTSSPIERSYSYYTSKEMALGDAIVHTYREIAA